MAGLSELDGYRRMRLADGIRLDTPDGSTSIRIWPRARLAPLRRLLGDACSAAFGADVQVDVLPLESVVTDENERAVLASASRCGDPRNGCTVAVCGDVPCLRVEVVGTDHRRIAELVVRELGMGLGRDRRRWYEYTPPPGWFGIRRDASALWFHPQYPRTAGTIRVLDARPFTSGAAERLDRWLHAQPIDAVGHDTREDVATPQGLRGRLRTAVSRDHTRAAVALTDRNFLYLAHFAGPPVEVEVFRAVYASIRPLIAGKIGDAFAYME